MARVWLRQSSGANGQPLGDTIVVRVKLSTQGTRTMQVVFKPPIVQVLSLLFYGNFNAEKHKGVGHIALHYYMKTFPNCYAETPNRVNLLQVSP